MHRLLNVKRDRSVLNSSGRAMLAKMTEERMLASLLCETRAQWTALLWLVDHGYVDMEGAEVFKTKKGRKAL